jgi:putative ABC transport system ATP-binding protein
MPLLETRNLEKVFQDGDIATPALRGVSFVIEEGEFVAVMGPSGSGKSTLLHILGFLDKPTRGEYLFAGRDSAAYSDDERAHVRNSTMGFVFQSFNLLPRTNVLENVKLPLLYSGFKESLWKARAQEVIESVGLAHRMYHYPSQLSGGEKQRVAIARALVNRPKVIFADEPTGNLDSKSGQVVMEIFQDLNEKKKHTILLITHETYTAENARRIIYLHDGLIKKDTKVNHIRHAKEYFVK